MRLRKTYLRQNLVIEKEDSGNAVVFILKNGC